MISRILAQLVGSVEEKNSDAAAETDECGNLLEFEDGEWVIINIHENQSLGPSQADFLENLLIEHPSMSVYKMKPDEEDCGSEEEPEDLARPVPVRRHMSWRIAAWGSFMPTLLPSAQRTIVYREHRKLTRGALNRQNLAKTRFSSSDRRCVYFKQPSQRLYNY